MHAHTCIYMYTCIYTHVCVYVYICMCVCVYISHLHKEMKSFMLMNTFLIEYEALFQSEELRKVSLFD